jgi:hypothetical protein
MENGDVLDIAVWQDRVAALAADDKMASIFVPQMIRSHG